MPNLEKDRSRAHKALARRQRKLARKFGARKTAHKKIGNAYVRIRNREQARSRVAKMERAELADRLRNLIHDPEIQKDVLSKGVEDLRDILAKRLTNLIQDDKREIQNLKAQIKELNSAIVRLKDVIPNIKEKIQNLTRRIKRKKRKQEAKHDICISPGSSCWGGGRDIFAQEVIPAAGVAPHSTKRSETFGNPSSDHYVGNVLSYAGDFPPSIDLAIRVARALGIPYSGYHDDYKIYYIQRDGHTYQVQIIAQNHGTGPHVHVGIERVS